MRQFFHGPVLGHRNHVFRRRKLFLNPGAKLRDEYDRLFTSIFNNPDIMKSIIDVLSKKNCGWSKREDDTEGTQIDMIIKRSDHVVNMCEMKYYSSGYSVNKKAL